LRFAYPVVGTPFMLPYLYDPRFEKLCEDLDLPPPK
jgi:hypothetical protein